MDYESPVEAVIPGVQGRVLGVLTRTDRELTMRGVAQLAGASVQQASVVVARLVELGLAVRRDVGTAALVRLDRQNEAARCVLGLASLHEQVLERLRAAAHSIAPAPASLTVFGSFVSREAGPQ
ncbi:MAG: hypothetical protein JO085_10885, partial [Acidimicrobiia bacterium]|nr:hypothetical protein [Acidimicrobiia bacterium]